MTLNSTCLCTGACMKPGGTCSAYPNGRPGGCSPPVNPCLNYPNFCSCDCHKAWFSVIPPNCFCRCNDNQLLPYKIKTTNDLELRVMQGFNEEEKVEEERLSKVFQGMDGTSDGSLGFPKSEEEKVEDKKENYATFEDYEYLLRERNLLMERIEKLELHKKTVNEKINEIVDFDNSIRESMTQLMRRIDLIVKDYNEMNIKRMSENTLISRRLTDLEVCDNGKKPHKCPVCDGFGKATQFIDGHCTACEGKRIVWG